MDRIEQNDRLILRELARKQVEYANSPKNAQILRKWEALAKGRREEPIVRLLCSNFRHEVLEPRLQCVGEKAREIEMTLLDTMSGRELFDDDTPISPTFDVKWETWVSPYGIEPIVKREPGRKQMGYHIEPVIEDLEAEFDKLYGGRFGVDREKTLKWSEVVDDVIGDILPIRMVMPSLTGKLTNTLVLLMNMESLFLSMYDCPDKLHEAMDMATTMYEKFYDFLEQEKLLLPTCGISPLNQESFAFNSELPTDEVSKTTQCWGFLESQEMTAVSPQTFGEFVFPYQDRLVKRFGLLSYGCCERVDAIWPDYLSKWDKLRKLSVSPFNNETQVGEYLRGSRVVYYSKPRAELLTNPGSLDEDALKHYFKGVCQAASGCLFEMAQREAGTIYGDPTRGHRYVEIAKECMEKYWKP